MKRIISFLVAAFMLCGCSEVSAPAVTSNPTLAPIELTLENWTEQKNYLEVLNSIRLEGCNQGYTIDENEYGAKIRCSPEIIIDCLYDDSYPILFYAYGNYIDYFKNDVRKQATLNIGLTFDKKGNPIWSGNLITQEQIDYPITFDMEKGLLLDNEEFSSTRGQPMKFVDNLNTKIINVFIRMWNQADLQRQLLEEWRHQRELIVSGVNPQAVLDAKEFVFDLSRQLTPLLDNENYCAYTRYFNMNVNREQIFSSKEAESLQRTLYVLLNVDYEINSPEELDLDSLLIPIIDITEINSFFTSNEPSDSSIPQYIYYIGYPAIIYEDTINQTVYELTGKKDVFKAVETKRLESGIFVDRDLQGFIFGTPDGEWIPVNSGVILLDQNKEGNQLRLTLIKYKPTKIYEKVYVEGEYIADINQVYGEINDLILDNVYSRLDEFQKWEVVLQDNGEDQLYQLISMKKVE